jgi:hypothetical protein
MPMIFIVAEAFAQDVTQHIARAGSGSKHAASAVVAALASAQTPLEGHQRAGCRRSRNAASAATIDVQIGRPLKGN